jgi:hypothetical protein
MNSPGPIGVALFVGLCTGPFQLLGLDKTESFYGALVLAFVIAVIGHTKPKTTPPAETPDPPSSNGNGNGHH